MLLEKFIRLENNLKLFFCFVFGHESKYEKERKCSFLLLVGKQMGIEWKSWSFIVIVFINCKKPSKSIKMNQI